MRDNVIYTRPGIKRGTLMIVEPEVPLNVDTTFLRISCKTVLAAPHPYKPSLF